MGVIESTYMHETLNHEFMSVIESTNILNHEFTQPDEIIHTKIVSFCFCGGDPSAGGGGRATTERREVDEFADC